jgi:Skp family chaperone for outer membrane proteins
MKIRLALLALAAFLAAHAAWAQTEAAAPSGAAVPTKVAVLNLRAAMANTAEGKQRIAALQAEFVPRGAELQYLQKQIEDVQTRMRAGGATLSQDEKTRLASEYDRLTRTFQRKQQDLQDDSNEAQQDAMNSMAANMTNVIGRFSKGNGYAVVLDTSLQQAPLLYFASQVDITQEIIHLYDKEYPPKAAAAAPKPALPTNPKPVTPKPQ